MSDASQSISDASSEQDEFEQPATKRRLECPRCNMILFSQTSLKRHKKVGCEAHRADKRLAHSTLGSAHQGRAEDQRAFTEQLGHGAGVQPQSPPSVPPSPTPLPPNSSHGLIPPSSLQDPLPSPTYSSGLPPQPPPQSDDLPQQPSSPTTSSEPGGSDEEASDVDSMFPQEGVDAWNEEQSLDSSNSSDGESDDSEWDRQGLEEGMAEDTTSSYGTAAGSSRRTAQWYIDRKDQPLYPGCRVTVEQQVYALLSAKGDHHLTDKFMDNHCKFLANVLLPTGNLQPTSLHLLKKIANVATVQSCEKHVCENDCVRFKDLRPGQYAEHAEEQCPVCNTSRFVPGTGGSSALVPRKVFWEIPLEQVLNGFFGDPEWSGKRGQGRTNYALDFYSSEEADRLNEATGGAVFNPNNSVYEVGIDWFQCFDFKQHSVGIAGIR